MGAKMNPGLKACLIVHGLITLAAALVLIIDPAFIPGKVNIAVTRDQYLLCYLLGAAELGVALLSFLTVKIESRPAVKAILFSFIVFHLATAVVELIALSRGSDTNIIFNIAARVMVAILFWYYGIFRNKQQQV